MLVFIFLIEREDSCGVGLNCDLMIFWCGVYYGFVLVVIELLFDLLLFCVL